MSAIGARLCAADEFRAFETRHRHCERSEAIQEPQRFLDCFVALRAPRNDGVVPASDDVQSLKGAPKPAASAGGGHCEISPTSPISASNIRFLLTSITVKTGSPQSYFLRS
jgi:hypothetical protein